MKAKLEKTKSGRGFVLVVDGQRLYAQKAWVRALLEGTIEQVPFYSWEEVKLQQKLELIGPDGRLGTDRDYLQDKRHHEAEMTAQEDAEAVVAESQREGERVAPSSEIAGRLTEGVR